MSDFVSKIVKIAEDEAGYHEKATNANLSDKTANAGNKNWNFYADYIDTQCPDYYNGKKNGYAWCCIFVDYVYIKALGVDNARKLTGKPVNSYGASCTWSKKYFSQIGRIFKSPEIGAQIYFKDSSGSLYHTGIVVGYDDNYVFTVEGNSSDMVQRKSYKLTDSKIDSYGVPDFDSLNIEDARSRIYEIEINRADYDMIQIKLV